MPEIDTEEDAGEDRSAGILPAGRRGRWLVVAVLGLALLLRIGVVLENRAEYEPRTDALQFDHLATSISNGDGFGPSPQPPAEGPTALRAPLYPAVLGAVYVVFGERSWTAGRLANAVFGTAAVAMVGLVAAQLFSRRVAAVALSIAAVHPAMILIGSSLQLEPLLVLLALGTLAAALQHRRAPRGLWWPVAAGVLLGLTVLTREIGFALVVPVAWLLWTAPGREARARGRRALLAPALALAISFAVVVPWTIRNAVQLDAFVPVTTSAGFGLAGTYNETALNSDEHPAQWIRPYDDPRIVEILLQREHPTEVEIDRDLREETLRFIGEHPTYPLKVAFWNTVRMFDLDGGEYSRFIGQFIPYPSWLTSLAIVASYVVLLLAVVGAFTRAARRVPFAVWLIPIITFVGLVVPLPGSIRYRASLEPFLVLLASVALVSALERWQYARRP